MLLLLLLVLLLLLLLISIISEARHGVSEPSAILEPHNIFFLFAGILGSASRAEFPVSRSNYVGFTPRLLNSSTHHSSESFVHLKTG